MTEIEICNENESKNLVNNIVQFIKDIIIKENNKDIFALIGIKRRGAILANRIREILNKFNNIFIEIGYLDITLYRDDLSEISDLPQLLGTEIEFDVKNKKIFLIDDVIFTGRTSRAAIDAILDLGRPKQILLTTLIDRNNRELPIQPDFIGKYIATAFNDIINVYLKEIDGKDLISLTRCV
jgi:pyrimidine operon attenuation protein/uracil phosphoribosyltransferase